MAGPVKIDWSKPAIRLAAAGLGAAVAGPLGAALGGAIGSIFSGPVAHLVSEGAARLVEHGAQTSGEALTELGVHYCYDKFRELEQPPLEDVVRESLRYALDKVRNSLDADLQSKYAAWFKNWDLRLDGQEQLPLESLASVAEHLAPGTPPTQALETVDNLFKESLERLNGEARVQQAIEAGKMLSAVGSHYFREMPEELLQLLVKRLPESLEDRFRELLTSPDNDRAWKTAVRNFEDYASSRLDAILTDTRALRGDTTRILEILLAQQVQDDFRKLSGPRISVAKLPRVNSLLIGREVQLEQLDEAWDSSATAEPKKNVVSIVAFGGVGKTSLAINWRRRNQAPGAKRILSWSFYSQGSREDRQASAEPFLDHALREWFGMKNPPTDSWARGEKLAELIRHERVLLILDGLEPIQFAPGPQMGHFKDPGMVALLRELEADNPGLCLCTSRLQLSDLDSDGTLVIDLENLTPESGGQYLKALGVHGPEEELQKASADFDNHALALTLLGSYLVKRRGRDVFQRDTIPSLFSEPKKGGHARRVLRQYEALFKGKPELDVLRILGLFDRPAEKGALKILRKLSPSAWAEALENLKDARLIEYEDLDGPLDCHPLIREHFGEEYGTSKPEEFRAAQSQLYEYYCKLAPQLPNTLKEMEPLFYAVYHGCRAGKHTLVLKDIYRDRILRGDEVFLIHKLGAFGVNLSLLANFFVTPWSEPVPSLSLPDQAWVTAEAAFALRALGRLREAVEPLQAAVGARLSQENWKNAAISLGNLSELHLVIGDVPEAIDAARRSREVADKSQDQFQPRRQRLKHANALHQGGDLLKASALFHEAERTQAELEPEHPFLYSVQGYFYCDLLLAQGESEEVLRRATQTLAWHEPEGWLLDIALDHLSLGRAHPRGSAEAAHHLDESVSGLRRAGTLHHLPRSLLARAAHFRHTHDWAKAQHDLEEVRVLATRCGMRLFLTDYHLEQARLLLAQGKPAADALPHYEAAKQLIADTGYHRRDPELLELHHQLQKK